jgi:hypothetical protein
MKKLTTGCHVIDFVTIYLTIPDLTGFGSGSFWSSAGGDARIT